MVVIYDRFQYIFAFCMVPVCILCITLYITLHFITILYVRKLPSTVAGFYYVTCLYVASYYLWISLTPWDMMLLFAITFDKITALQGYPFHRCYFFE